MDAGDNGFGSRLRWAREQAHLSQEVLAGRTGIGRDWLGKIERGAPPTVPYAVRLHLVLAELLPDLSFVWLLTGSGERYDGRVESRLRRRRFLQVAAVVPATIAASMAVDLDRFTAPAALDAELLDGLEGMTEQCARLRPTLPPRELLPMIETHVLSLRRRIIDGAGADGLRRRLLSIAAGSAALAAWVCTLMERRQDARAYLDLGESWGREVNDRDALAVILMLRADLLSAVPSGGIEGYPIQARARLDEALALVSPTTSLPIRAPLLLRNAEEHACVGLEAGALRYLDEAAAAVANAQERHHYLRPTWGRAGDVATVVTAFRGNVLQLLGHADEAIELLTPSLGTRFPADRPAVLTDLGAAHARRGDLDASCRLLHSAADLVEEHGLPVAARRIAGVRRSQLTRWDAEQAVRDLDERLAAIL